MAKQSGLGDQVWIDNYNLGAGIAALTRIGGGPALLEVPDITKSAMVRLGGLRTGEISFNCWFDDAGGAVHEKLKALPTVDVILTYGRGTTLGNPAACMVAKQINYDWTRGADGSLAGSVQALSNGFGLEWCRLLTAGVRTDTGATNGASVLAKGNASTNFGLSAYLHVIGFTGTDATVKIQESSDNAVGDPFADVTGGGFAAITGSTKERIVTGLTLTVEKYLRVVTTTSAGFTSMDFVVSYNRHLTATAF